MQYLEVSVAVRHIYASLGFKGLITKFHSTLCLWCHLQIFNGSVYLLFVY